MEKLVEVKTVMVHQMCDNCENGEFLPTGEAYMTYPAQYPHVCGGCGKKKTFDHTYPRIEYRKI